MEKPRFSQTVTGAVNIILGIMINAIGITHFNQDFNFWQSLLLIFLTSIFAYLVVILLYTPYYAFKLNKYVKVLEDKNQGLSAENTTIANNTNKLQNKIKKQEELIKQLQNGVRRSAEFNPDNEALADLDKETTRNVNYFNISTID